MACETRQLRMHRGHVGSRRGWGEGRGGRSLWERTTSASSENFPDTLNCAQVEVFPLKRCEDAYPGEVSEGMICAGDTSGADSCQVSDFRTNQSGGCLLPPAGRSWGDLRESASGWARPMFTGREEDAEKGTLFLQVTQCRGQERRIFPVILLGSLACRMQFGDRRG